MNHPLYVYTPRSPEVLAKLRASHRRRLGIPEGHVRIYGIHVPEELEWPLRYYAAWVRGKHDWAAAQRFVQRALDRNGEIAKPSPDRLPSELTQLIKANPDMPLAFRACVWRMDRFRRFGRAAAIQFLKEAVASGWTIPLPDLSPPPRGQDWALVEELLAEYATREEVATFLGISEGYLKNVLRRRHDSGESAFGRRIRHGR